MVTVTHVYVTAVGLVLHVTSTSMTAAVTRVRMEEVVWTESRLTHVPVPMTIQGLTVRLQDRVRRLI